MLVTSCPPIIFLLLLISWKMGANQGVGHVFFPPKWAKVKNYEDHPAPKLKATSFTTDQLIGSLSATH